jgi:hypothetical protein
VVAHAWRDERYAEFLVSGIHPVTGWSASGTVAERFSAEALAMHHRVTGLADLFGRLQPPWPRALGTPPWAVARQLSAPGAPYVVRQARFARSGVLDDVRAALEAGDPVAVFVGDRWMPRHVVVALRATGDGFGCYDPARGGLRQVSRTGFVDGPLRLGRWDCSWFVVRPRS